jgi:predicted transcriptional regulator
MSSTVRISDSSHRALRELAEREHAPLQTVLERAIENYRRDRFLDAVNSTFAALRSETSAWHVEVGERDEWDRTNRDGDEAPE